MPNKSSSVFVLDTCSCYELLKEDMLSFKEEVRAVLQGDFNGVSV